MDFAKISVGSITRILWVDFSTRGISVQPAIIASAPLVIKLFATFERYKRPFSKSLPL